MKVGQALRGMQDTLTRDGERPCMRMTLRDPRHGQAILVDLEAGFPAPLIWTQTDRLNSFLAAATTF